MSFCNSFEKEQALLGKIYQSFYFCLIVLSTTPCRVIILSLERPPKELLASAKLKATRHEMIERERERINRDKNRGTSGGPRLEIELDKDADELSPKQNTPLFSVRYPFFSSCYHS